MVPIAFFKKIDSTQDRYLIQKQKKIFDFNIIWRKNIYGVPGSADTGNGNHWKDSRINVNRESKKLELNWYDVIYHAKYSNKNQQKEMFHLCIICIIAKKILFVSSSFIWRPKSKFFPQKLVSFAMVKVSGEVLFYFQDPLLGITIYNWKIQFHFHFSRHSSFNSVAHLLEDLITLWLWSNDYILFIQSSPRLSFSISLDFSNRESTILCNLYTYLGR